VTSTLPLLATRNELIGWVAPPGARTEAYTWPVTAFVGGIAIGSALAGGIVEASSWRLAFLVAAGAAAVGAVVAVARGGPRNPQVGSDPWLRVSRSRGGRLGARRSMAMEPAGSEKVSYLRRAAPYP
jgi:MFS family permease